MGETAPCVPSDVVPSDVVEARAVTLDGPIGAAWALMDVGFSAERAAEAIRAAMAQW